MVREGCIEGRAPLERELQWLCWEVWPVQVRGQSARASPVQLPEQARPAVSPEQALMQALPEQA